MMENGIHETFLPPEHPVINHLASPHPERVVVVNIVVHGIPPMLSTILLIKTLISWVNGGWIHTLTHLHQLVISRLLPSRVHQC